MEADPLHDPVHSWPPSGATSVSTENTYSRPGGSEKGGMTRYVLGAGNKASTKVCTAGSFTLHTKLARDAFSFSSSMMRRLLGFMNIVPLWSEQDGQESMVSGTYSLRIDRVTEELAERDCFETATWKVNSPGVKEAKSTEIFACPGYTSLLLSCARHGNPAESKQLHTNNNDAESKGSSGSFDPLASRVTGGCELLSLRLPPAIVAANSLRSTVKDTVFLAACSVDWSCSST
mmetsp:Transcript_42303/g.86477  ORF Transcript_42303/g.86477 Transcript_42303/m.86477 type:complete len:233 (-) Transcript_42303:284-982(-)